MTSPDLPINVVGAGLAGCMAALLLSNQGEKVRIIENRPDIRTASLSFKDDVIGHLGKLVQSNKRSVNLALSHRGIEALKKAGVFEFIEPKLIPMHGRVIHSINSAITYQSYGHDDQAIYSISRNDLNCLLLDHLTNRENVELMFETKIQSVKPDGSVNTTTNQSTSQSTNLPGKFTIGADGAFSSVRESMRRSMRMDFQMEYISAGYKELHIPPITNRSTNQPDFALSNPEGLHIWPRHDFMLIALPNPDKSFTCTLFAPFEMMEANQTPEQIREFLSKNFPDAVPLMPTMVEDYQSSPSSALLTVKCSPWVMNNRIVLVGDAAHATVPFYGQGMNAAFEDCLFLTELYEKNQKDVVTTLQQFNDQRVNAGHALCDLSLANFKEMSSKTASSWFLIKKKIEGVLNRIMPNTWIPLYTMVAFTRIPYDQAKTRAARNEKILNTAGYLTAAGLVATAGAAAWAASKKYQK